MKKQLFALFISYLFGALYLNAQSVDAETAQSVALHFFNSRNTQTTTEMRRVPGVEAAYYIFEPVNGEGFVMVSSERSLTPILAYSLTQKFDLDGAPANLKSWLGNYTQQIQFAAQNRLRPNRERNEQWTSLLAGTQTELRSARVGPLLTTKWGQSPLYNRLCPVNTMGQQAVTGCVATAMAQIMKYWNYPLVGYGVAVADDTDGSDGISGVFSANIGETLYHWSDMPNVVNAGQWSAIAQLMRDAGISVNMNYGTGESGAYSANVPAAMHNYFRYSQSPLLSRENYQKQEWEDMLRNSISNGIPVYYAGRDIDDAGKVIASHAWVCDGYESDYFHMNWGWDGADQDTWFSLDFLAVQGNLFDYNQRAIFGLTPQHCTPDYFSVGVEVNSVQVSNWVHANSMILQAQEVNVVFAAGDEITLLPGFSAPEGSSFSAWIAGCGGRNSFTNVAEGLTEATTNALPAAETGVKNQTSVKALSIAPNPFSGSTTVIYTIESEQLVSAQLLDMTGRLMAKPISQQLQVAGEHRFTLEANNVPAGLYFLVLQTGAKRQTQRVVITK